MKHPRYDLHRQGRALMQNDDFAGAVFILRQAYETLGPQAHLLTDLASCYYMLNDYGNFRKYTLITKAEFEKVKTVINAETRLRVSLGLGKLLEELGHLAEALEIYKIGLSLSTNSDLVTNKIRAQYLRVLCFLGKKEEIYPYYMECEQVAARDKDIEIDIQNALMIGDYSLLGPQSALQRIKPLLQNHQVRESCRRLLLFNYIFESLKSRNLSENSMSYITDELQIFQYFECDSFEQCLWDIWLTDKKKSSNQEVTLHRSEQLSPLCGFRYLYLLHQRTENKSLAEESRKKAILFLNHFDQGTRKLLLKNWDLQSEREIIRFEIKGNIVINLEGQTQLKATPSLIRLMSLFKEVRVVTLEDLALRLYEAKFDVYIFDRLRMTLHRANKKFEIEFGVSNIFNLKKAEVVLSNFVEFKWST